MHDILKNMSKIFQEPYDSFNVQIAQDGLTKNSNSYKSDFLIDSSQ